MIRADEFLLSINTDAPGHHQPSNVPTVPMTSPWAKNTRRIDVARMPIAADADFPRLSVTTDQRADDVERHEHDRAG
jgi:hypothetical protein